MMPCEDWHIKIVRVLDSEAGDKDEREVAEHLRACASCREFHDKFVKIRGEFRSFAEPKVPAGIRQDLVGEIKADIGMQTRRKWYLSAAAVLIAGLAFLGGRLSVPRMLPMSVNIAQQASAEPDGITVPSDLVAWLDAARLFGQLGMEDRMADAVESAGRLLPHDTVAASSVMAQGNTGTGDDDFEYQNKHSILAEILRPHESVESFSGIMAQSFGGNDYEGEMD
ncbi:MAG: anti-sigma factor family protein [Planctomycetota bacterium]|jgi:anti-sigma factor RsiW